MLGTGLRGSCRCRARLGSNAGVLLPELLPAKQVGLWLGVIVRGYCC